MKRIKIEMQFDGETRHIIDNLLPPQQSLEVFIYDMETNSLIYSIRLLPELWNMPKHKPEGAKEG